MLSDRTRLWNRRDFLRLALLGGVGTLSACSARPSPLATASLRAATSTGVQSNAPTSTLISSSTAAPTTGVPPSPTPSLTPTAPPSPSALIKQVVVFIQENHTFDSL